MASNSLKPKIVVSRNLGKETMSLLDPEKYDIVLWPDDRACERPWLLQNVPGASAVIVLVTDKIDAELLDTAGSQLKVVSTMSVGFEHVDVKELAKRNIKLGYTPDVLTDAVADLSIMLALMAGRLARETMTLVNEGNWPSFSWSPFLFCGPQLSTTASPLSATKSSTRVAGFVGFGRIAQATMRRLIPFGYTSCIYASNPSSHPKVSQDAELAESLGLPQGAVRRVSLDEVAVQSDVVFVLTPGGPSTLNLINEAFLRQMKNTAVLVNTSRGSVVDSDALARALREGWIWGAGLDVVAGEPNVGIDHPLVKEPRCVILPHIGSATLDTRLDMATLSVRNALAGISGENLPASVDLARY